MGKDAVPPGSRAEVLKRFGPDVLDYSKCEFATMVDIPLPDAVKDMLTRCFQGFGWDVFLLRERWTATLPNGKKENEVFPHAPGKDICCADTAAWTLYQTGKLPHEGYSDKLWDCKGGGFHWAPYWVPIEGVNTDLVRIVHKTSKLEDLLVKNDGDPRFNTWKTVDDDWLPGDYLLYSHSQDTPRHPAGQPGHINVYLGPFREVVDGKPIDPVYHLINGSIGEGGGNAVVRPKSIDNLQWYLTTKQTVWHCRVVAVEALFREVVGYPVRLAKPKPLISIPDPPKDDKTRAKAKKEDRPREDPEAAARAREAQIARLWDDATGPSAAYPLGKSLSWHDGVHFHLGEHLASDDIVAFGPGQIALARMGGESPFGNTSFVLVQHRVDPKTRRLLAPPAPSRGGAKEDKKRKEMEGRAITFYSLYMHVAPLAAHLEKRETIEGVPALAAHAPPWLRRVWLEPVPPPREFVPDTAAVSAVITMGEKQKLIALSPLPPKPDTPIHPPHACDKRTLRKVTAGGKAFLALPHDNLPSNAESWSGHAPVATAPKGAKLVYVNKLDGTVIETGVTVPTGTLLSTQSAGYFDVPLAPPGSGTMYVALRAFTRPGFYAASAPKAFEEVDAGTLRIKAKLSIALDTRGEGDGARLVANQSAKINASAEQPLVVGFSRRKGGKGRQADQIWLDLVPAVALPAAEKVERESNLVRDLALAQEVNARLASRQSTLFAVKIGKGEDWKVGDNGLLVPNDESLSKRKPEAQVLTLYPQITGTGGNRRVVTPKPLKQVDADSPSLLTVAPGPGVAVFPVEIFSAASRQFALVEIMFAVDESAVVTSHEEEQRVKQKNQKRRPIVDRLMKGEIVDFFALARDGTISEVERSMGAEIVGRFGKDEDRGIPSFHFEIFSGKDIIDPGVKGSSGAAVPVPDTRWVVLKDDKDDPFTPAFIRRVLGVLTQLPPVAAVDTRPLAAALATGVAQPSEWAAFYKANVDALSRLITVHRPEWAIPWEQVWQAKDTRGRSWSDGLPALTSAGRAEKAQREAAQRALQAFRWWGDSLSLPGVEDVASVFFYHPLRFIEWLKTGIDLTAVGLARPEDAAIELILDGESIPLDYDPVSGSWSFRTVLGDIRQGKNARLVLKSGFATENKEIEPVRIRRGEVATLSVVDPSLKVDVETDTSSSGFAVALKQESIAYKGAAYLLADGNLHMAGSAYSRATFRVDVAYNVAPPDALTIEIAGDALRFATYAVTGIEVTADGDGAPLAAGRDKGAAKPAESAPEPQEDAAGAPQPGEDGQPGGARVADDHSEDAEGEEGAAEDGPEGGETKSPEPLVEADGTVVLPSSTSKRKLSFKLVPPKRSGPITRPSSFSVTCEVMVSDAKVGEGAFGKEASVTLKASAQGGDLGSREAKAMRIKTRAVRREEGGTPSGEDIAKLQVYLSQIHAADHHPCYRFVGSHSVSIEVEEIIPAKGKRPEQVKKRKKKVTVSDDYQGREEVKKGEKPDAVQIDGGYGGELARGLWRFIYSYAARDDWKLGAVKCSDAAGKDLPDVPRAELTSVPVEDLLDANLPVTIPAEKADEAFAAAHADLDHEAVMRFLARVNHPEAYPVVEAGLLAEIVKRFRTPFVLPRVTFDIEMLSVPRAHPDVIFTKEWSSNWIGTSAVLPGDDEVILKVKCPALGDVHGDLEVVMSVPEESGYRLGPDGATSVEATLADLVKDGGRHALSPSGKLDADPKHNTVSVRTRDGRLLNKVELCGAPDLGKPFDQPTRAAALMQIYLSVVPADPQKPEAGPAYKHTETEKLARKDPREPMKMARINGKWDKSMVALLDKWKSANDVSGDYPAAVKALKKAYDEAPETGRQDPPPAEGG